MCKMHAVIIIDFGEKINQENENCKLTFLVSFIIIRRGDGKEHAA